jgi:hypothetical protein
LKTGSPLLAAVFTSLAYVATAQNVVVSGPMACGPVIPAQCYGAAPVPSQASVGYPPQTANFTPIYAALTGRHPSPNVIYFGGPNSRYQNSYGCGNSSVIYFERGQAYYGGYVFTRQR